MGDRNRDRGGHRDRDRDRNQKAAPRQSTFFINGTGIDREVITTDICRYLGNDALVKPGSHQDQSTGATVDGYYITAYRAPTSAQLTDLRNDSSKWLEEKRKNSSRGIMPQGGYDRSQLRSEIWGPSDDAPPAQQYQPTQPAYPGPPVSSGRGGPPTSQPARYAEQPQYSGQANPTQQGGPGGYRQDQYGPNYVYSQQQTQPPLATVTYQSENRGRPADPPRMMAPSAYQPPGPGAPPPATYAGRGEPSYGAYPQPSDNAAGQGSYADPFYGRPGPASNTTFQSAGTMEDEDSELYDNDEMDFDSPQTQTQQTPAHQPSARQGGGHREDSSNAPTKRNRHGHR